MDAILEDDYDLSFDENGNAWGSRRTKLLIEKRLALSTEFDEGKRKKSVLWNLVLRNIRLVEPAFPFTVNDVKTKFYNLLTTYKRVKQRNSLSGRGRTNWIYFETFDEVYGNKHSIQPPDENICSTFTCSTELEENNSEAIKPDKRRREPFKKKDDELLDFLKEQNNIDQQRHQEFMAMEKQRTEIELQKLQALREMQAILKEVTQTSLNF